MIREPIFIPAPRHLLSTTGKDVAKLEEYVQLKTRKPVIDAMRAFLEGIRKAREVEILFVKAEWGEGKTSIYDGYLKREDWMQQDIAVKIETITILSWLERTRKGGLFSDTENRGVKLFGTILLALSDHISDVEILRDVAYEIKSLMEKYKRSTEKFVQEALRAIFARLPKEAKLIIFIDEFEDIIDRADLQDDVIIGLVQIKNGSPAIISSQGEFAGRVHFIIAVTPAAYVAITSGHEAQIGRFLRRIDVIELHKVNRLDAYNFITGALNHCFDGKIPRFPFTLSGLINTVWLASMGNLGAMAQIINQLLRRAVAAARERGQEGKMKIVNHVDFVNYMRGYKVGVYGGELEVLSSELMARVDDIIKRNAVRYDYLNEDPKTEEELRDLVYRLIADTSPIPISTIYKEYGEDLFSVALDVLEKALGLSRNVLLLRFKRVKMDGERFHEIVQRAVRGCCEGEGLSAEQIKSIAERLLDALRFPIYGNESLQEQFFIFYEKLTRLRDESVREYEQAVEYIMMFCPELSDGIRRIDIVFSQIYNKVKDSLSDEIYVMLSPIVFNMLYPSPTLMFLDFIEDADKRLKIWLETRRELREFETEFRIGVISLLTTKYDFLEVEEDYCLFKLRDHTGRTISLRVFLLTTLNPTSISEDILHRIENAKVPLILIFCWGELGDEVKGALTVATIEGDVQIRDYLIFPLIMVWAQQVVGYVLAKKRGFKIREEKWRAKADRLLGQIAFETRLRQWLEQAHEKGFMLLGQAPRYVRLTELGETIRPFLYFYPSDKPATVSDIFRSLDEMDKTFRIFGRSFPVNPLDVSSEDALRNHATDLQRFSLIEYDRVQDVIRVIESPIERRIKAILRRGLAHDKDELKCFFVNAGGDPELYLELYLKAMKEKGIIEIRGRRTRRGFYITDITILDRSKFTEEHLRDLKRRLSDLERESEALRYGLFATKKERDCRLIDTGRCLSHIKELLRELEGPLYMKLLMGRGAELIFRARAKLLDILIDYVKNTLNNMAKVSARKARRYFREAYEKTEICKRAIREEIKEPFNELLKKLSIKGIQVMQLREEEELERRREDVEKLRSEDIPRDLIDRYMQQFARSELYIDDPDIVQYFRGRKTFTVNIRAYLVADACRSLTTFTKSLSELIDGIKGKISEAHKLLGDILQHPLFSTDLEELPMLARLLYEHARQTISPPTFIHQLREKLAISKQVLSLTEIREQLNILCSHLSVVKRELDALYSPILNVRREEENLLKVLGTVEHNLSILLRFFSEVTEFTELKELENVFKEIKDQYEKDLHIKMKQKMECHERLTAKMITTISQEICQEISSLVQNLGCISNALRGIIDKLLTKFKAELRRIDRLFKAVEKYMQQHLTSPVISKHVLEKVKSRHNKLVDIIRRLSSKFFEVAQEVSYQDIINSLVELRRELVDMCKRFLTEAELIVYEIVCELVEQEIRDFPHLVHEVASRVKLEDTQVVECLIKLNFKGIIGLEVKL